MALPKSVSHWSVSDVSHWLEENHFQSVVESFKEHEIDGKALLLLESRDIAELFKLIGPRVKFRAKIKQLLSSKLRSTNPHHHDVSKLDASSYPNTSPYNFIQFYPNVNQPLIQHIRYQPFEQQRVRFQPIDGQQLSYQPIEKQQVCFQPYKTMYEHQQKVSFNNLPSTKHTCESGADSEFTRKRLQPADCHYISGSRLKNESTENEIALKKTKSDMSSNLSNQASDITDDVQIVKEINCRPIKKEPFDDDGFNRSAASGNEKKSGRVSPTMERQKVILPRCDEREPLEACDVGRDMATDVMGRGEYASKVFLVESETSAGTKENDNNENAAKFDFTGESISMIDVHSKHVKTCDDNNEQCKGEINQKAFKINDKPSIEMVTNRLALRERSKIFRRSEKKWHVAVNDTAYELAKINPQLLNNKKELRLIAESEVRKTYRFAKGKSRSIAIPENRIAAEEKKRNKMTKEKLLEMKRNLKAEGEDLSRKMRQCHMNLTLSSQQSDTTKTLHLRAEMQRLNQLQANLHFRMDGILDEEQKLNIPMSTNMDLNRVVCHTNLDQNNNYSYLQDNPYTQVCVISSSLHEQEQIGHNVVLNDGDNLHNKNTSDSLETQANDCAASI